MDGINKTVILPVQKILTKAIEPVEKVFVSGVVPVLSHPIVQLIVMWVFTINTIDSYNNNFYKFPNFIKQILINPISKVVAIFFTSYYITKDFFSSLGGTIGYLLVYFSLEMIKENFELSTTTDIMPGCVNITVKDLLSSYDGEHSLKTRMFSAGVPTNLEINDKNAPLIASYLVGYGDVFVGDCYPPS